jgi:hypothetical protein
MADETRRTVRTRREWRRYDAPYRYYNPPWLEFFRATAYAAAEFLVGGSRVAGDFVVDTADSIAGRRGDGYDYRYDVRARSQRARRQRVQDEVETPEEVEVEVEVDEDVVDELELDDDELDYDYEYDRMVGGRWTFCDNFDRAFDNGSRVVGRSARRFADEVDAIPPRRREWVMRPAPARPRARREEVRRETVVTKKSEETTTTTPPPSPSDTTQQ